MSKYHITGYKVYKKHWGQIPIDEEGRKFDIHHIDGDETNNDPWNLLALPLKVHYMVHEVQGDWRACFIMSKRMKIPAAEVSILAKKACRERVKRGTHNLLGGKIQRESNLRRSANGTHPWVGHEGNKKRILAGTHNFLNPKTYTCPHCNLVGKGSNMKRYHFDNCEAKPNQPQ